MEKKKAKKTGIVFGSRTCGGFSGKCSTGENRIYRKYLQGTGTDHCLVGIFISEILLCGKT